MSKIPIRASRLALVVAGIPWSWAAGMKWVPIRPLVDHPQIQKDAMRHQNVRLRLLSRRIRIAIRAAGSRAGRRRRDRGVGVRAVRRGAGVGGTVAQHRPDAAGRGGARRRLHEPGGPAPAGSVGELGDRRQEHQLTGGAGGREHPDHHAAVPDEPPVGDDRAEDQGQRAGPDARPRTPTAATAATGWSSPGSGPSRAATRSSATATTRRMPNRSISAAAKGAVRP